MSDNFLRNRFNDRILQEHTLNSSLDLDKEIQVSGSLLERLLAFMKRAQTVCENVNESGTIRISSSELKMEIEELECYLGDIMPTIEDFIRILSDKHESISKLTEKNKD